MPDHDVVVVGAGPSGSACAYWLAEAGYDVLLVEKKHFPREKTCGDGLTPRAVKQLDDMGLADQLSHHHRFHGLRSIAFGRTLELEWPATPGFPTHGYVVTRHDLDAMVAERAEKAGAVLWQETEAVAPIVDRGLVRGAVLHRKEGDAPQEVRTRREWPSAATSPHPATTSRGSSRTSTSAMPTATCCRGTAGSSRWATAA